MLAATNNILFRRPFVHLLLGSAAVVLIASTARGQQGGLHRRFCPYPLGCQPSSAAVPLNVVRLYEDKGFDGRYVDLALSNFGDNELHSLSRARFDDEASSAQWNLEPGVIVILYEEDDPYGKGEQYPIWGRGQDASFKDDAFNNDSTAWAWFYVGGGLSPSKHVCTLSCHDHYYDHDGRRVVIQSVHRHGPDCGHHWSGSRWLLVTSSGPTLTPAPSHVCTRLCHNHYYLGEKLVVIKGAHRHHDNCGHRWTGKRWVVVKKKG